MNWQLNMEVICCRRAHRKDSYEIKSHRAEPSQNKECTILAGQALSDNEAASFNDIFQQQRSLDSGSKDLPE
ncbi:protein of unknown function [Shewanella benthica]|uniref:Uncharacterized protein n=1 Tax=Shewanella benthica TaxID=43661 RepID=A0A330LWA8_9GAMM|nr:hypothetical protein [Shewanella benthica]SQH74589.1 protein of unknown function [Shewanella benthica]